MEFSCRIVLALPIGIPEPERALATADAAILAGADLVPLATSDGVITVEVVCIQSLIASVKNLSFF
jgi:hypothetical protein